MPRFLCIWFPNWPIQRWHWSRRRTFTGAGINPTTVALYESDARRGPVIAACSSGARQAGVKIGLPLTEATSLLQVHQPSGARVNADDRDQPSRAVLEPTDRQADRKSLQELAWICHKYTPLTGFEDAETPDALLLEISGCAHLFGGENGLAGQLILDLYQQGLFARIAIADTLGAAWAVAHHQKRPAPVHRTFHPPFSRPQDTLRSQPQPFTVATIVPAGEQERVLGPLPVSGLRLPNRLLEILNELGIERIEQLRKLPRSGLPSRFGKQLTQRLDQALGSLTESLKPIPPPLDLRATHELEIPSDHLPSLWIVLTRLVREAASRADQARWGILQITVHLDQEDGNYLEFTVNLSGPTRNAEHLIELTEIHWQQQHLTGRIQNLAVEVTRHARLEQRQRHLFEQNDERTDMEHQLSGLLNRMIQRLGPTSVLQPRKTESQHPQDAMQLAPFSATVRSVPSMTATASTRWQALRPVLQLTRPVPLEVRVAATEIPPRLQQIQWKQQWQNVTRQWGPERVESHWWTNHPVRRDYYRIEVESGQQFWIYQQLVSRQWFCQGLFD